MERNCLNYFLDMGKNINVQKMYFCVVRQGQLIKILRIASTPPFNSPLAQNKLKELRTQMSMLYKMSSLTPNCEPDYLRYRPFNCKYQMHKEQHETFNFIKIAACRL